MPLPAVARRAVIACMSVAMVVAVPRAQAPAMIIRHATVVDVASGRLLRDHAVLVRGDLIERVGPDADVSADVAGATTRIDAGGRYLIPGLWDMHVHALWDPIVTTTVLPLMVTDGITGVRDMGGTLEVLRRVRAEIDAGTLRAPRVVAAGPILDGPEPVDPSVSIAIDSPAAATAAVATLAAAGVDFIKVYTLLPAPAFRAVVADAQRRGLRVSGHVPADITPVEAAAAGMASIEHMRAELGGFCTRATEAACVPIIAAFRAHGTWQVPTLSVRRARAELDDRSRIADSRLAFVPGVLRAQWLAARTRRLAQKGPDDFRRMRGEFADEQWLAGLLHRERIALLAGSDAGADFSYHGSGLHDELRELVRVGLSPLEALQSATIRAAVFLGQTGRTGQILSGAGADLVLLESNPLEDITSVARIHAVMSRGRWLDRPELDRLRAASRAAAQ